MKTGQKVIVVIERPDARESFFGRIVSQTSHGAYIASEHNDRGEWHSWAQITPAE